MIYIINIYQSITQTTYQVIIIIMTGEGLYIKQINSIPHTGQKKIKQNSQAYILYICIT